jgi:hypothetical protein
MTFYYYLKKQLYILAAASLSSGIAYFIALYYGWRDSITISYSFTACFVFAFIFVGAILRFMIEK